jgi:hypothetical protein
MDVGGVEELHHGTAPLAVAVANQYSILAQHAIVRNAFPGGECSNYLLHDRDAAFTEVAATIAPMQIQDVVTARGRRDKTPTSSASSD